MMKTSHTIQHTLTAPDCSDERRLRYSSSPYYDNWTLVISFFSVWNYGIIWSPFLFILGSLLLLFYLMKQCFPKFMATVLIQRSFYYSQISCHSVFQWCRTQCKNGGIWRIQWGETRLQVSRRSEIKTNIASWRLNDITNIKWDQKIVKKSR